VGDPLDLDLRPGELLEQAVGQAPATLAMAQLCSLTTKRPSPALAQSAM
jgi:hypothetical protein